MARHADPTSKRQRGFKILDRTWRQSHGVVIEKLMKRLDVSRPYAETIYATHRREGLKTGKFVKTYAVVEQNNGKPCKPRIATKVLRKEVLSDEHHLTAGAAKIAYIEDQRKKINFVEAL